MVWRCRITITWLPDYLNCLFSWILGLFFLSFSWENDAFLTINYMFFLACRNGVGHLDWSHRGGRWKWKVEVTHRCLRSKFSQRPNLNASDIRGKTALIFASSYGHREARLAPPSLSIFLVGWIGWLGCFKSHGGGVVKETGASNAPGNRWNGEFFDPTCQPAQPKSHKPGSWWLDCLKKNDQSRGLYLVGNFEYSTYFCRLFFVPSNINFNIFMVWQWRQRFLCFLGPLTHLTFRTSWKHQPFMYIYRQIYREPSHGSIMVTMNFGRWWTTCWTRPRIVLRSMPLMTLTRQPCIMQPGGDLFLKSRWMKGWHWRNLLFFWLAVLGTQKLESYKSNICMYI